MAKNNNTLVFNGLMQGMSWDLIKEAKDEIKRHLGEKPPTKKDILTDWIIGKDYMLQLLGNSFALGGDYLSWLNQYKEENPLGKGESYSWGDLSKAKLKDSFSNGNGFNSALGIAGTALNWTKGFIDSVNSIDNSAQLNDAKYIAGQQINFGDNASLMNTLSNLLYADTNATATDVGGHSFGQSAMNVGKDAFSGVTTGLNIGGPIGGAVGLAAGLAKGVIQEIVTNSKAKEAAETANLISGIANDQINQKMGYASDKSQLLAVLNQLQNMAKNGGKLKKSHKFANGGLLNNYYYGLEEVNAGGSHEENPNEGVVVSYAPDGLPNKVEEGETIHNDYVYSKRLEANKKVLENNLLDEKYEGKSFADISKKLTEDRKQRPNDPISVRTNEENLNRLQGALEELKLDNKTREVKRFLGSLNNDLLNALQLEMMDEYKAYAEQLAQQLEQEDLAYQEELAALEGIFGKGGHLKQGDVSSSISRLRPVYKEGKIVGWENPDYNANEKVLSLSGYNPNYEGALIYADDRNWFLRNITSPWNTWWNNLPSPEFSWAARNLTPIGIADAAINGDTERILESALLKGMFGKGKKAAKAADEANDALSLLLEAQLGLNTTKEVTKEATKKSLKWLRNLGIGVGLTGLPLAGFYITDIEKNKDKYDLKALERGRNVGDTIVGDWQFKGDTIINAKTGEKIYSKGGHINLNGNKLSLSRYEAVKALFGKYLNGLTPEEVDGNIMGYRDIFGRFVPVSGLPLLTVPSYLVVSSDTNTNTDTSKSGGLKSPQEPNRTTTLESPNYLSYLRYAPILGSLGLVLSDTLGLSNQPDYSNIDMYKRAVDSIGGVNFVPIGGYLQYTPIDREYIANQLLALAASYNRALNNTNPVGSYILGLVNDAKVRDQIGDMYINTAAQDLKDRLAVAEYNRGIDITNARNSLAAQLENARLRTLRANEYQKIATMRDNERNIAEAARAANYDKFITNIGNLGKEEFAFNLVDSNAALLGYYTDRTGRARYRMPAFIKPDGFEAYKQYLKSHGVEESQIDA